MQATATPPTLADRFSEIIDGLCRGLGRQRNAKDPTVGPMLFVVWLRLLSLRKRFAEFVARFHAGRFRTGQVRQPPAPRPAASGPGTPRPAAPPDAPKLPPQSSGWLIRLASDPWELNAWREPLEKLLVDPELAALLQVAPKAGRVLRVLCRMLHIPLPPVLALPPRRPRRPAPKRQRPPRPVNVDRPGRLAFARLLHTPRDNNTPPTDVAYARGYRPPKPDRE